MLLNNPKFKTLDFSTVDYCVSGAAPFPRESQEEFESVVGKGKIIEVYGMTETSPLTTMNPAKGPKKLGSIGIPILNTDIKLVDPDTGEEVPIGQPGEICVKGPMVMKGYLNKPEETAKAIDSDGYMHTGDVAVFDEDGYMRIVDRTKDMIIVSGYKVFSAKLEDTLVKHPDIEQAATIGIPNPDRPGSEIVKAYILLRESVRENLQAKLENAEAIKERIIEWARDKVAKYEMPKVIEFRPELPLTTVGKVDKKVLRQEIVQ
jgi:long-chain acyl-CoA synthetase